STVSTPETELSLPHNTTTDSISIPRSDELLNSHVNALEHVNTKVLRVNVVHLVYWANLIVDDGDFVVRDTSEAKVSNTLTTVTKVLQRNDQLVTDSSAVSAIEVAA